MSGDPDLERVAAEPVVQAALAAFPGARIKDVQPVEGAPPPALSTSLSRSAVLEEARAWVGTPYVLGGALKGVGCDCVGLIRGVYRNLYGAKLPEPHGWRADWHAQGYRAGVSPLIQAARAHFAEIKPADALPGDLVGIRLKGRVAHCGILGEDGRLIHAIETHGTVEVWVERYRDCIRFAALWPGTTGGDPVPRRAPRAAPGRVEVAGRMVEAEG